MASTESTSDESTSEAPETKRRAALPPWFPAAISAAILLVLGGMNLGIEWTETYWAKQNMRLVPALISLAHYAMIGALLTIPLLIVLHVRARSHERRSSRATIAVSIVVHVLLTAGIGFLSLRACRHWMMADKLISRKTSPDGKKVAYLYNDRFLGCVATVYIRKKGYMVMREGFALPYDCEVKPHLNWKDDAGPTVVDEKGEPVSPRYRHLIPPFH